MFLFRRPTNFEIEKFIDQSRDLPLSYGPVGIAKDSPGGFKLDCAAGITGRGKNAFDLAGRALTEWRQFDLGWVELFPRAAPVEPGTTVAVLVRHAGVWSLNGCRVVYSVGDARSSVGFAYGTLTNHAEMGEEIFQVSIAPASEEVIYEIRAVSKPRAAWARIGYPYVRFCQSRFRRDSIAAMRRAVAGR
jgi:uncharacterized protein (UPF0548 family)